MKSGIKTAAIGLSTLEAMGIKSILIEENDVTLESFDSLQNAFPVIDRFDLFIVSSGVFASNPDFFMPKKQRLAVVDSNNLPESSSSTFPVIGRNKDESDISEAIRTILKSITSPNEISDELSKREIEVIRLVADGMINKEIAERLCISVNTVITHRKNISAKLGIKSASGLSLYAVMNGLI